MPLPRLVDEGCSSRRLLQQRVDKDFRIKRSKVIRTFAEADELDRYAEFTLHLHHDAAFGGPVQLRKHDAGHIDHLGKDPSLVVASSTRSTSPTGA